MPQITTNLNQAEYDELMNILPATGKTIYAFVKDAIEVQVRALAEGKPKEQRPIVREMIDALHERKWHLYQMEDYSDRNHKEWLSGRFRKASKSEVADALALFRQEQVR